MIRIQGAAVILILLVIGCAGSPVLKTKRPERRIVAYVFPRGFSDLTYIGGEKLTHINYAFGTVSLEGEVELKNPNAPAYLAQIQSLKARNPSLKILLSVGGWGADNFSDAALSQESRRKFASSAIAVVRRFALDGVDLDWEYPGQPGPGIKYRPEDKQNFTLMLQALREQLDALSAEKRRTLQDRYLLTIASSGDDRYFQNTEMEKLHVYLDFINVMTYDFTGGWSARTGHHSRLYGKSAGATGDAYIRNHLDAGIPSEKIVLGIPFYGKGWIGVNPENAGLDQPFEATGSDYSYSRLRRLYTPEHGFTRYWDAEARAPYLWNPDSRTFITFDDPQSLEEKARFVKEHDLGGVMYWEHSHDYDEVLLDVLYRNLR